MLLSDDLLEKISIKSGVAKEEILYKIDQKSKEFSGLITKEGAAYIVMKELGVEMDRPSKIIKLNQLVPGSARLDVAGRVVKISPTREFTKSSGGKGRVANIYISDGSGYVRLPLWDDQVNLIEEGSITLGSIVQMSNVSSKENPFGELEISLGKFGTIGLADDIYSFPAVEELLEKYFSLSPRRTSIDEIIPGDVEIAGTIVQVFNSKFVFTNSENENYLIISCIIADGTGDIRTVFFRDVAESLSDLTPDMLSGIDADKRYEIVSKKLLGKEIFIRGRVVKNKNFDRFEMTAAQVKSLNVLEESRRLVDSIETAVEL